MKIQIEKQQGYSDTPKGACCTEKTSMKRRPLFFGIAAGLAVIGFYLGLISLTSDWYNAKAQFIGYRWWIVSLAIGLGLQVGLFTHMRHVFARSHMKGAASGMAASGGISGAAMVLCCSHYLAGLLPIIGLPFLSAAVAGLAQYQTLVFLVGVISNILGLTYMLWLMYKNGVFPNLSIIHQFSFKVHNKNRHEI